MAGYAAIEIIGHLGRDPEVRHTQGGQKVANFSIAVSKKWKDGAGNDKQETTWFRCNAWEKTADVAEKYLKKGNLVHVNGEPTEREYEKDGVTRKSFEVRVNRLTLMPNGQREDGGESTHRDRAPQQQSYAPASSGADDDIPF